MTEEVFFKDIDSYNIHFLKQFQDFQVPSPYLFNSSSLGQQRWHT